MITGVRVEWAKSRARANRFTEEVRLLLEEMKRIELFLQYKANDWEKKGEIATDPSTSTARREGLTAYAKKQATFYRELKRKFLWLWKDVPSYVSRMQDIIANPSVAREGELDKKKLAQ